MQRLGIRYRQGWAYLVSPDPLAPAKLRWIDLIQQRAQAHPERGVRLGLDERTFYRLPTLAPTCWDGQGRARQAQMRAGNHPRARVLAALKARTGSPHSRLRSPIGVHQLCLFYQPLRAASPDAEEIYVIQDCWPGHVLPEVGAAAGPGEMARVALPTYSSWRHPIEKRWRWLKPEGLHLHRWSDDWQQPTLAVRGFRDQFALPSPALLH